MEIGIRFVRANIFPRLVSILASAYVSNRKNRSTRREREIETIFSFETELSSPPTFLSSPFHIFPRNDLSESFPPFPPLPSPDRVSSRITVSPKSKDRCSVAETRTGTGGKKLSISFTEQPQPGNFRRAKPLVAPHNFM